MVTVKERTIKNKRYVYVAGSVSYKGQSHRFEKLVGPSNSDPATLKRRTEFFRDLIELKCLYYRFYLTVRSKHLRILDKRLILLIELIPFHFSEYLASLYPSEVEKYRQEFDVRYIHNTTAIEGNTVSLSETGLIMESGIAPRSKKLREIFEITNYGSVLKFIRSYEKGMSTELFLELHRLIQRNIDDDSAGTFRKREVGITGSELIPTPYPLIEEELQDLITWYRENPDDLHPVELAGSFHHRFLTIHPFIDGNGRVARELLNLILRWNGFPPIIIPVREREGYIKALEQGDSDTIKPFLEFIVRQLVRDYWNVLENLFRKLTTEGIAEQFEEVNDEEEQEIIGFLKWQFNLFYELMDTPSDSQIGPESILSLLKNGFPGVTSN
jgi:Fic family protein